MKELIRKMQVAQTRAAGILKQRRSEAPLGFDPLNATTIDGYSAELVTVQPPLYAPLKPNQVGGRVRMAFFTKTFAAEASGTDLALCVIPKGARLLNGVFQFSATLGGTATVSFGLMGKDLSGYITSDNSTTADGVALLMAALASSSTAKQVFLATGVLYFGYETQKELYLTLTTAAASMSTQVLTGYIEYVVD